MTCSPLPRAASISDLMYLSATQASSPQEVRQRLIDWRIGSGRSPQNAQLTSMIRSAGRLPKPARAPNPPAANTALSRSVRNLFQIGSLIAALLPRSAGLAYPRGRSRRFATVSDYPDRHSGAPPTAANPEPIFPKAVFMDPGFAAARRPGMTIFLALPE